MNEEKPLLSIQEIERKNLPSRYKVELADKLFTLDDIEGIATGMLKGCEQMRAVKKTDAALKKIQQRKS